MRRELNKNWAEIEGGKEEGERKKTASGSVEESEGREGENIKGGGELYMRNALNLRPKGRKKGIRVLRFPQTKGGGGRERNIKGRILLTKNALKLRPKGRKGREGKGR